jgi:hypothetical protein
MTFPIYGKIKNVPNHQSVIQHAKRDKKKRVSLQ